MKYLSIGLGVILLCAFLFYMFVPKPDYSVVSGGTFNQDVYVFITKDTAMVRGYSLNADFNSLGCTVDEDGVIIVWFPEYPTKGLLAHEMGHATYMILNRCGVPHTDDTDEVYAYQINYLIDEFYGRR